MKEERTFTVAIQMLIQVECGPWGLELVTEVSKPMKIQFTNRFMVDTFLLGNFGNFSM